MIAVTLSACNDSDKDYTNSVSYDLGNTNGEWQSGFADYPVGGEVEWELTALENQSFTLVSGEAKTGYYLHSYNRSDDTKMYLTRQIDNLKPNTHYDVSFSLEIATNVNDQCFGIGGAPHAVTVKTGLSKQQPDLYVDEIDHYRMNIDIGNQVQEGLDGQSLGHIGESTLVDCSPDSPDYALKQFSNADRTFEVTSDEQGKLWLTFATDSGFEGPTSIYVTEFNADFVESEKDALQFEEVVDFSVAQPAVEAVFFDYPIGREFEWELTAAPLTEVADASGNTIAGYLLHSYNRSDDTGMLLNKPIKGLAANASYVADVVLSIATNVNNQCFGIGGAPHSVAVKTALSLEKPAQMLIEGDDHYRINLDIGNNFSEGNQGLVLGDIGEESLLDCNPDSNVYAIKPFNTVDLERQLNIETDERGIAYFSIMTDSGFEGPTTILFTHAAISFTKM